MRELGRPLLTVSLVLIVAVLPFLLLGESFETRLERWLGEQTAKRDVAIGTIALLAADIVLPVPSSGVSTLAGAKLGIAVGTAASWLGMSLGSIVAFAVARLVGTPLVERMVRAEDRSPLEALSQKGGWLIAVTRPLPILAEATTLLLGSMKMSWRSFLPVVLASNFAISLVYVTLGSLAIERGQLLVALAASVLLPLLATLAARRLLRAETIAHREANG